MNIYVGNLPYGVSETDLRSMFEAHGEVASVNLITDKFTGNSKGFGFVEMPQNDQAQAAVEALNGAEVSGRKITVNEARPREERPRKKRW